MDERTRPPKCPRCATPTQSASGPFAPPGALRPGAPAGGARPSPRNLEPVGAPPVFGGATPVTGTASGQTLYGLPVSDDVDELTMLGDDSDPLGEPMGQPSSGPPSIGASESSGNFDTADLFESTNYGEVDLSTPSEDGLELDLPGLSVSDRAAAARPTSRDLPPLVDDDDLPMPTSVDRSDETTRRTVTIPTAPPSPAPRPAAPPMSARSTTTGAPARPVAPPVPTLPRITAPPAPVRPSGTLPSSVPPPAPAAPPRRTGPLGGDSQADLPIPARASGNEGFGSQANLPTPSRASGTGFGGPSVDLPAPSRPGSQAPAFARGGGPPPHRVLARPQVDRARRDSPTIR